MYAGFFGLEQAPFSIAPDPRYLYRSERHREALAHLLYGMEGGGGFVVLTGEIGAGKTTVCRHFLEHAPAQCRVAYIFNPRLSVADLLATICHEFGLDTPIGAAPDKGSTKVWLDALNADLLAAHARGENSVLVIDEAQSLPADVLEQLRLLTNLETRERKLLQIVLIGQPELRTLLARPELEQLAQRVIARYHLGALSEAETRQYIEHRLRVAGLSGPLPFGSDALARVYALSRGVPRRINLLCDRALLGAYAQDQQRVSAATVEQAASEVFDASASPAPRAARAVHRLWSAGLAGAVAGIGITALVGWWAWHGSLAPSPPSTVMATQPRAPAPAVQPPAESAVAAQPEPPTETTPDWSALHSNEVSALAELADVWALAPLQDEPCANARQQQHQCYRMPRMTLNGLQTFDRPAVLRLHPPDASAGYALLTEWNAERITLRAQDRSWSVPADTLAAIWRGEYASYWRTPVQLDKHLTSGFDPQVMPWMEASLTRLQQQGVLPPEARLLSEKVQAFQRVQGLETTGRATPTTMILINRAIGVEEPALRNGMRPLASTP